MQTRQKSGYQGIFVTLHFSFDHQGKGKIENKNRAIIIWIENRAIINAFASDLERSGKQPYSSCFWGKQMNQCFEDWGYYG